MTIEVVEVIETTETEVVDVPAVVGQPGPAIELQATGTHIQWRVSGTDDWTNVVPLSDLEGPQGGTGPAPELQTAAGWIQWREPEGAWQNLVQISTLVGPQGLSAYQVAQSNGYAGTEEQWLASLLGPQGVAGTVAIGTVTTGNAGSSAAVENVGTAENAILNITIPRGDEGDPGTNGTGWTGGSYNPADGTITFTSADGLGFTTGDLRGADGNDGLGWTGASYDPETGKVTFTSADGLGFETGDLRGQDGADGIGVPDPTGVAAGQIPQTDGADGYELVPIPTGGGGGSVSAPVGEWEAGVTYSAGDSVTIGNQTFLAVSDPPIGEDPRADATWEVAADSGGSASTYNGITSATPILRERFTVTDALDVDALRFAMVESSTMEVRVAEYVAGSTWDSVTILASGTYEGIGEQAVPLSAPVAFEVGVEYEILIRNLSGGNRNYLLTAAAAPTGITFTVSSTPVGYGASNPGIYVDYWGTNKHLLLDLLAAVAPWRRLSGLELPDAAALPDGKMMQVVGGAWVAVDAPTGGGGGATVNTDIIGGLAVATGASVEGTLSLGTVFKALHLTSTTDVRVRLYRSTADRTADAARPPGALPDGDHGVILDATLDAAQSTTLAVPGYSAYIPASGDMAWSITNDDPATQDIAVTLVTMTEVA